MISKFFVTIVEINAKIENNKIIPEMSVKKIRDMVMDSKIVVLKQVFKKDELLFFRKKLIDWGKTKPPIVPSKQKDQSYLFKNHHRIDDNPVQSETPHKCHFYNLIQPEMLPDSFSHVVKTFFELMKNFQNELAETNVTFFSENSSSFFRPQVIQYPSGGGFFAEHKHTIEPQRIGLIAGLSKYGVDFQNGGTTFVTPEGLEDSELNNDIGDITLFRIDLLRAVSPVDSDESIDWNSDKGRWTMVLPYY